MPVCPTCGSRQPDGAVYCDDCGAKLGEMTPARQAPAASPVQPTPTALATTCPVCGAPVTPGEAFCDDCGAALGSAAAVPPPQVAASPPSQVATPAPFLPVAAPAPVGALVCSTCGAQLEPGSRFCDMCGAPVSAAPPSPPPSQPVQAPVLPPIAPPLPEPYPAGVATPPSAYPPMAAIQGRLVVQGTNATLPFPPGKTEVIVGREDPISGIFPDIDLTDHGGDEGGVSRQHARIFVQGNQVFIEDLNSTNYTYVNQQKLTPQHPHPLNSGDEIRFGRLRLQFSA